MRLKKLTSGVALLGLSAGFGLVAATASSASAASATIRPYIFNAIGVGQTDAGVWDNSACVIGDAGTGDHGMVNGSPQVPPHANQKDVNFNLIVGAGIGPQTPVCVPVDITVTGSSTVTPGTKPGGTLAVTSQTDVQGGISAASQVTMTISYSGSAQSVKLPSGASVVSGSLGPQVGGGSVTLALKPGAVKTKAVLTTSCEDQIEIVDTTPANANADGSPAATTWDGSTLPGAGEYFATMRNCATSAGTTPGKAVTTKIAIIGDGTVNATFVEAQTQNPATWDTTAGTACSAVKAANTGDHAAPTFGSTLVQQSRIIQCKGNYGKPVQFALDVRAFSTNGTPCPSSCEDPYGLAHPATISFGGGTFSN